MDNSGCTWPLGRPPVWDEFGSRLHGALIVKFRKKKKDTAQHSFPLSSHLSRGALDVLCSGSAQSWFKAVDISLSDHRE